MAKPEYQSSCPVGGALNVFAGRWKPEILWHLSDGPIRFNKLQRSIGQVSQKMLTQQLRELQRDGLIKRTQYPEIPPRVEYEKTKLADSLTSIFNQLEDWNRKHQSLVSDAQQEYDAQKE